jgi:hypothetical protein
MALDSVTIQKLSEEPAVIKAKSPVLMDRSRRGF